MVVCPMGTKVKVKANRRPNSTGMLVQADEIFHVTARGESKDSTIPVDADGLEKPWLNPARQWRCIPDAPWFWLSGAIGEDEDCLFALGVDARVTARGRASTFSRTTWGRFTGIINCMWMWSYAA